MEERLELPIALSREGEPVAFDCFAYPGGVHALTLSSCSSELGVDLTGAYVGHESLDGLAVAEVVDVGHGPGVTASFASRVVPGPEGALVYARRVALYDHLQRFQELAGGGLGVDGIGVAALALDPLAA